MQKSQWAKSKSRNLRAQKSNRRMRMSKILVSWHSKRRFWLHEFVFAAINSIANSTSTTTTTKKSPRKMQKDPKFTCLLRCNWMEIIKCNCVGCSSKLLPTFYLVFLSPNLAFDFGQHEFKRFDGVDLIRKPQSLTHEELGFVSRLRDFASPIGFIDWLIGHEFSVGGSNLDESCQKRAHQLGLSRFWLINNSHKTNKLIDARWNGSNLELI